MEHFSTGQHTSARNPAVVAEWARLSVETEVVHTQNPSSNSAREHLLSMPFSEINIRNYPKRLLSLSDVPMRRASDIDDLDCCGIGGSVAVV